MEKWKKTPIDANYDASTYGRIRNNKTGHITYGGGKNRRYLRCKISGKEWSVHRVIALTWCDNPYNKPHVNHIDGNKHNNQSINLEWVTPAENHKHAINNGLAKTPKRGQQSNCSKLDDKTIKYIKSIHKPFNKKYGTRALAKRYGVNECWLSGILTGNSKKIRYRHLEWK